MDILLRVSICMEIDNSLERPALVRRLVSMFAQVYQFAKALCALVLD